MMMITRLKQETQELHDRVEDENLARQIMSHDIDLDTYKLLLLQNYLAYKRTEEEIKNQLPDYKGNKHLQLRQDLNQLGVNHEPADFIPEFNCTSKAQAFGAAYVVEGSALGGLLLAKNIEKCAGLKHIKQHHFFNGNKDNLKEWNFFKKELEGYNFSPEEESEAILKAKETFTFFAAVFRMEFSPIVR